MARTKKVEIITEAKPHTIKKFELIERYVDEWARKILGYNGKAGQDGSKGVIFIDCMCNSGEYRDIDGIYVEGTALRVAKKLNEIILNYPGKEAVLIFNDISSDRVEIGICQYYNCLISLAITATSFAFVSIIMVSNV